MKVKFVDGERVRAKHCEFALGGHPLVYPFVPKGEVWLERMRSSASYRFTFAHEMIEIILMKELRYPYLKAHDIANRLEGELRRGANVRTTFARYLKRYVPRANHLQTISSIAAVFRKLR